MELLTQAGLSLTAIIVASNSLTNLFKFIFKNSAYKKEYTRLLNFGFSILITGLLINLLGIENAEIGGIIIAVLGSIGAENIHESNKNQPKEYEDIN